MLWWLRAQESRGNVVVTHPSLTGFFGRTNRFALLLLKRKRKEGGKEEAVTIVWGDRQKKAGLSKNAPQQPPPT